MTGRQRPLENVSYAAIANARKGARSTAVNIPCPVCGPNREGLAAKRRVLRTWTLDNHGISIHCVRCGLEGWVAPDGSQASCGAPTLRSDDDERKKRNAELAERIWRESCSIIGTAGEAYFAKRGIDITAVPDCGGLRWAPRCLWEGGIAACIIGRFSDALTGTLRGIWRRPVDGQKPKTLGPMAGSVIRLWPDDAVTNGLVLAEGIETALAASQIEHRGTLLQPIWAAGCADNMRNFPVLPDSVQALTIIVDNDANQTGQNAAAECVHRWVEAGRDVIRLIPKKVGADFNDILIQRRGVA